MPQSLTRLYAHLIFSTKNREAWLDMEIRPRVHAYLATIIRDMNSPWVVVGGVADHVHILFDMGKMVAPVKFVEHVKRESSKFVKTFGDQYRKFYWQRGYGMFSVSPKDRDEAATDEHGLRPTVAPLDVGGRKSIPPARTPGVAYLNVSNRKSLTSRRPLYKVRRSGENDL